MLIRPIYANACLRAFKPVSPFQYPDFLLGLLPVVNVAPCSIDGHNRHVANKKENSRAFRSFRPRTNPTKSATRDRRVSSWP